MRFLNVLVLASLLVLFEALAFSATDSPSLESLQGKWSAKRPDGETRSLEFDRDKVTIEIVSSDGQTRLLASGSAKAVPLGLSRSSRFQTSRADDPRPI